ncbi:TlpA family protein disulfide reductase [Polaribacter sp.]|uniref:TlpA family protein disulfide reductase n=1 Tax=Polaribacter sp. TaxID=1920175 RepID=UPI003F6D49F8
MKSKLLLLALIILVSCKTEQKVNYSIIEGNIQNANSDKLTVYNQFDTSIKKEIVLLEDGTFKDTIFYHETNFYFLREGNNMTDMYIPNGENVVINYNASSKDSTLNFTGDVKTINNYLSKKKAVTSAERGDFKALFMKEEADFKAHLVKIKEAQEDLLNHTEGISTNFKNNEAKNIYFEYLMNLNNYPLYHPYYTKKEDFKVSENFLEEMENLDLSNEANFYFSQNYRSLLNSKLRDNSKDLVDKDSIADDVAFLKTIAANKSEIIKNKLLFDDAKYGITYTNNLEEYYKVFSENSTNKENNEKIAKDYQKIKALAKGNASPKFENYENNAGGEMSLDDLKGKYVYFDIWATWCGPCIREIPFLKKVEKEYHDKNIAFVSVSIDTEKAYDKWKKMIIDRELGGIQLLADNAWESQFIEDYMIKGIPRFILLDPNGNIIDANAPRPSNKKLTELLNELNL